MAGQTLQALSTRSCPSLSAQNKTHASVRRVRVTGGLGTFPQDIEQGLGTTLTIQSGLLTDSMGPTNGEWKLKIEDPIQP